MSDRQYTASYNSRMMWPKYCNLLHFIYVLYVQDHFFCATIFFRSAFFLSIRLAICANIIYFHFISLQAFFQSPTILLFIAITSILYTSLFSFWSIHPDCYYSFSRIYLYTYTWCTRLGLMASASDFLITECTNRISQP